MRTTTPSNANASGYNASTVIVYDNDYVVYAGQSQSKESSYYPTNGY
jgi:hypothetical protein